MNITNYKQFGLTKTQASIVNALLNLLQNYAFQALPITTICMEADVGRATFYRNFDSKEAILKLYLQTLTSNYFSMLETVSDLTIEKLAKLYFEYWSSERAFIEVMHKNNLDMLLLDEAQHVEKHIQGGGADSKVFPVLGHEFNEIDSYYFHAFYFAGFWRMITLWAGRGFKESAEEMTAIFLKIYYNDNNGFYVRS